MNLSCQRTWTFWIFSLCLCMEQSCLFLLVVSCVVVLIWLVVAQVALTCFSDAKECSFGWPTGSCSQQLRPLILALHSIRLDSSCLNVISTCILTFSGCGLIGRSAFFWNFCSLCTHSSISGMPCLLRGSVDPLLLSIEAWYPPLFASWPEWLSVQSVHFRNIHAGSQLPFHLGLGSKFLTFSEWPAIIFINILWFCMILQSFPTFEICGKAIRHSEVCSAHTGRQSSVPLVSWQPGIQGCFINELLKCFGPAFFGATFAMFRSECKVSKDLDWMICKSMSSLNIFSVYVCLTWIGMDKWGPALKYWDTTS